VYFCGVKLKRYYMKNTIITALIIVAVAGIAKVYYNSTKVDNKWIERTETGVKYYYSISGDTTVCTSFDDVANWSNLHN
jgi:hypothetical protein